ncbi:MAG: lytic transglycosylase F [Gammaproteobacteria bacterium]
MLVLVLALPIVACDQKAPAAATTPALAAETSAPGDAKTSTAAPSSDPKPFQDLATADILNLNQKWTGDYNGLEVRRFLRALVPFSKTLYYLDGPEQRGIAYEALRELEKSLPAIGKSKLRPKIVIIPTPRDRLLSALAAGYGDIAIGAFAVTDIRRKTVAFSVATDSGIEDVVVTRKDAPAITIEADLAGREIHVRRSSSYHEDLAALNGRLTNAGLKPVLIQEADSRLEDEDIMQMVDAGIVPATVGKRPVADFWVGIYDQLTVHPEAPLRTDGTVAWAIRKDAPQLEEVVNSFVKTHRAGTLFGNILINRYLGKTERLKNPISKAELSKYRKMASYFQKYATAYDMDWLLAIAQGYQESALNQSKRSRAGAVGVMQIKPSTAAGPNVGIRNVEKLDNNIHAGIKYMRFLRDRYFSDPALDQLDRGLFTLAAYNAGPARIASLRTKAKAVGLDSNQWFGNVEIIAAREIGHETVNYVGNIYKYYTAYKAMARQRATQSAESG